MKVSIVVIVGTMLTASLLVLVVVSSIFFLSTRLDDENDVQRFQGTRDEELSVDSAHLTGNKLNTPKG